MLRDISFVHVHAEMKALQKEGLAIPGSLPRGGKRWHGAPMAAINRGFVVTGAPWMKLPEKEWEELRTLQRLYTRELPELDEQPLSVHL